MKVLYLEDSPADVWLIKQYMSSKQHDFVAVDNRDKAVAHLQAEQPDVFMIDLIISGELVVDLISYVVQHQLAKYVIAITARALPQEQQHYLQLGCDKVIAKPYMIDELDRVLQQLIS